MSGNPQLNDRRVHAAPLGFEEDRIVLPAVRNGADRVWLLVPRHDDTARDFLEGVRAGLAASKIEVRTIQHDRGDLFDIIRATREIISREGENHILVNLSSGSKIQAVGCMMACMMFNSTGRVRPYYAEPEEYRRRDGPLSTGVREVMPLPQYTVQIPPPLLVNTMHVIRNSGNRIRKKDLLNRLQGAGLVVMVSDAAVQIPETPDVLVVRGREHYMEAAGLSRMTGSIIDPLIRWNFVRTEKVGRSQWVSLTEEGLNAVRFMPDGTAP